MNESFLLLIKIFAIYLPLISILFALRIFLLNTFFLKNIKHSMKIYLVTMFLASFFIKFAYFYSINSFFLALYNSISYTFEMFSFKDTNISIYLSFFVSAFSPFEYYITYFNVFFIHFTAPLLLIAIIGIFMKNSFSKFVFKISTKNKYIFSEINKRSMLIAKKLIDNKNSENKIFFISTGAEKKLIEEIESMDFVPIKCTLEDMPISLSKNSKITIILSSENDEKNINDCFTLNAMNISKNAKKIPVHVLLHSRDMKALFLKLNFFSDKFIFTSAIIGDVLLNTYLSLYENPLFSYVDNEKLNIGIIGDDIYAYEFLKACTWCGQLRNVELNIYVALEDIQDFLKRLKIEAPYLILEENSKDQKNVYLKCFSSNICLHYTDYSQNSIDNVLNKYFKDANYTLVASKDYRKNLSFALSLNDFYKDLKSNYLINYLSDTSPLTEKIKVKTDSKLNLIDINNMNYVMHLLLDSTLEKVAEKVHLSWEKDLNDEEAVNNALFKMYNDEYNYISSLATAVHSKYKINLIEKEKADINNLKNYTELYVDLLRLEHNRWNSFVISRAYRPLKIDDFNKYFKQNTSATKNKENKLHSCIVKWNDNIGIVLNDSDFDNFVKDKSLYYSKLKSNEIDELDIVSLELYAYRVLDCNGDNIAKIDYKVYDANMIDLLPQLVDIINL